MDFIGGVRTDPSYQSQGILINMLSVQGIESPFFIFTDHPSDGDLQSNQEAPTEEEEPILIFFGCQMPTHVFFFFLANLQKKTLFFLEKTFQLFFIISSFIFSFLNLVSLDS